MRDRLLQFYDRALLAHPWLSLLLILALLGGIATRIPDIRLEASADTLVLEGDEALAYFREIGKRFGSQAFLVVTYRPREGDLMSDAALERLARMREDLREVGGVQSVTGILDVPLLYSPRISFTEIGEELPTLRDPGVDRDLARREFLESPIYRELVLSPDGQTTAMQLTLAPETEWEQLLAERDALREAERAGRLDVAGAAELERVEQAYVAESTRSQARQRELIEEVRAVLDRYRGEAEIFLGGVPMIAVDMITFAQNDLAVFGAGILAIMVLVLAVIFRRLQWVLIPLAACTCSCLVVLGLIGWAQWPLTVVSSNFVPLVLILSLAITIYLINHYREENFAAPETPHRDIVRGTVRFMVTPILYTSATTGVAFASFVTSGIKPVIDFGWMMSTGIAVAMLSAFTIVPVLMMIAGKPKPRPPGGIDQAISQAMARVVDRRGRWVLAVAALLLVAAVFGISRLEVENRFIDYFDDSTEIYRGMEMVDRELGGTIPLTIVLDLESAPEMPDVPAAPLAEDEFAADFDDAPAGDFGEFGDDFADDFGDGADAAPADPVNPWFTTHGLSRVNAVHDYLEGLDETGKVLSLATVYDVASDLLGGGVDDIQLAIAWRSLSPEIRGLLIDPYLSQETNQALVSLRVKETAEGLRRNELLQRIRTHLVEELGFAPEDVHMTGMLVLYNNVLQSLYRSQILTLGVTFAAILVMFLVLFRSLPLALLAIAPTLLAAGTVLGGMGIAGVPLDIMTITIAAIVVGIGVDTCIHYTFRFRHEFGKDHDYRGALFRSHGSIGKAMYYTSVTIIAGFSILALSNFRPSIYFGVLTACAMGVAMLGALLLLPRLLMLFRPLGPGRERVAAPEEVVAGAVDTPGDG